jgi:hypothetical protein
MSRSELGDIVKQRISVCVRGVMVMLSIASAAAQVPMAAAQSKGSQFAGTWSGRWEASGSGGGFELTIESKENVLSGPVSVTGEPTYKATLKKLSFEGNTMAGGSHSVGDVRRRYGQRHLVSSREGGWNQGRQWDVDRHEKARRRGIMRA